MTSRHLIKVRALTAAAIAFLAIPMSITAYAQDETPPPPATEVVAPAADAAPADATPAAEPPAEGSYEAFMAGPDAAMFTVNNLWILISAALVFIMHLGFSAVESGMCQKKNCVNIMFKNVFIVCIGALTYMVWGFNSMYPGTNWTIRRGISPLGSPLTNSFRRCRHCRQHDHRIRSQLTPTGRTSSSKRCSPPRPPRSFLVLSRSG